MTTIHRIRKTRHSIIAAGGEIIANRRAGEVTEQVWRLPDGTLWYGDDWYGNGDAIVYLGTPDWYDRMTEVSA